MYEKLSELAPDFHVRTPIQPMPRLAGQLGIENLYIKRDDLTDFLGNKTRHAKYLIAWARAKKVERLIIKGRGDSNTVRIYAAAFKRAGFDVHLDLTSPAAGGNGAAIRMIRSLSDGPAREIKIRYDQLKEYAALGYFEAAGEILEDMPDVDLIYLYSYDASWIGLSIGLWARAIDSKIIAVRGPGAPSGALGTAEDKAYINQIYEAVEGMIGCRVLARNIDQREIKGTYGITVRDVLNLEGVLLDPVYTGRAMAALISDAREGKIPAGAKVLFWHTGGVFKNE